MTNAAATSGASRAKRAASAIGQSWWLWLAVWAGAGYYMLPASRDIGAVLFVPVWCALYGVGMCCFHAWRKGRSEVATESIVVAVAGCALFGSVAAIVIGLVVEAIRRHA